MVSIKNFTDIVNKLNESNIDEDVLKDILFQIYIIEKNFKQSDGNEIVVLDTDEDCEKFDSIADIEEVVGNYIKQIYILSDYGKGKIVYSKKCSNFVGELDSFGLENSDFRHIKNNMGMGGGNEKNCESAERRKIKT